MINLTTRGDSGTAMTLRQRMPFGDMFTAFDPFWMLDMFGDAFASMWPRFMGADVARKNGMYTIEVPVPGFKQDQIDITIEGNVIDISARGDRRYLTRSFTIMENFDHNKVNASLENGLLTIELGTQPEERKRISISGASQQGRGSAGVSGTIETSRRENQATAAPDAEARAAAARARQS